MRVCLLASGSGGNSIYIQNGSSSVLIDAGLTGKRIEERLQGIGVDPSTLQGIVVSHEHSDHIKGVGILARRYHLPVWLTEGTLNASKKTFRGTEQIHVMDNDEDFSIGDLAFQAFQLPHDAADPVNFVVTDGNAQVAIATDMGVMTQLVYQRLREVDFVVIESNYDLKMLMDGPYPWDLKKRISGRHGHLPNDGAAETLCNLALEGLQQAVLAHLSEKNNHP
ncbi:MAG: MBL fold metallo-hydrolase, partial [Candidatus Latescibacteria bacterium]|nr:MBL fold metallo-hydrolase [Candidatus Latescibacterota bacterium]